MSEPVRTSDKGNARQGVEDRIAIQIPKPLRDAVKGKARRIRGGTLGLTKFVWMIAAYDVLDMEEDVLRMLVGNLRAAYENEQSDLGKRVRAGERIALADLGRPVPVGAIEATERRLRSAAKNARGKLGAKRG